MTRITAIVPEPGGSGAVRIEVDGARFGTVPAELVAAEGLTTGGTLSEDQAARLSAAADFEAAYRAALEALRRRDYTRVELGRRLERRGHTAAAADAALDRAEAVGLLDDAAYAMHYVQTRTARGRGPARLRADLLAKGVTRTVADRAIAAEWPAGGETGAMVLALATKRAATLGALPRPVKRRRLLAYLARRGFTGHTAMEVVAKAVP